MIPYVLDNTFKLITYPPHTRDFSHVRLHKNICNIKFNLKFWNLDKKMHNNVIKIIFNVQYFNFSDKYLEQFFLLNKKIIFYQILRNVNF